ncbi:MAG: hypothetical protein SXV54_17150, partial [Chloroflexota bacterium]|nr:hypothetical protein [Chloroflexota bacterium]
MGRRTKLTPEVHNLIVQYIRGGAFDYVAAQAAGIDPGTFRRWLNRGEKRTEEPFRTFCTDVKQARAQARIAAENKVFDESPFNWLRYGPGRERPGEPGWTDSRQVDVTTDGQPLSVPSRFEVA